MSALRTVCHALVLLASLVALPGIGGGGVATAGPYPDRVADKKLATGSGFGLDFFPANVLGAPQGNANSQTPTNSADALLTLGNGGWIVLAWDSSAIVDGPGADFIVFENAFAIAGDPDAQRFIETATVAVSAEGDTWTTFTFQFTPRIDGKVGFANQYSGLAGVNPTLSAAGNGIPPSNPTVSGGDPFDLADVGLSYARYVRIRDTGLPGTSTEQIGANAVAVTDSGNAGPFLDPATQKVGFDLDAVVAINWSTLTRASAAWSLME